MEFKNIKVRSEQTIGYVQIDRVAEKNSLDIETSKEILQALQNFDQDNSIKCIAIEGNQKLFSPGADIKELQNLTKNKAAEQKLFDEATASLKKKDFAAATQGFLSFLQRFPGSGYTAQAYYFMGSIYLAEGDCKNAMPALQTVINRFPLSQRAPDAMLNLAICQDDLNDESAARDTLEALIKKYPASSAATNAKSRLGTLK